jgi:hypothetical protein
VRGSGRVLIAVALAVAGCAALAGCGKVDHGSPTPPELSAPYSTVDGEYQQAKSQLALPPGVAYPDHLPNTADRYLPGSGANQAQNFWLCAWLREYLATAPVDPARARQAVGELPRYTAMSAYTAGLQPEGRALVDAAIQGTQRGDRGPAGTFVQNTGGGPFYGQATSATPGAARS